MDLVYEAPILVIVSDFVIIRAIMKVVKKFNKRIIAKMVPNVNQAVIKLSSSCHQAAIKV